MTVKEVYDYTLIELNKVEAPTMLLEDFIYILNKAIINYVNKRYTLYEISQQLTDDLRVLTAPAVINAPALKNPSVYPGTHQAVLPSDYFHILNCSAGFLPKDNSTLCATGNALIFKGVKKMTTEMASGVIDNYYNRPSFRNPYFYIRNVAQPTISIQGKRVKGDRVGNVSPVNIELIFGKDINRYTLSTVHIDYLRTPQWVSVTEAEIEADTDTSQVLEFPHYVCLEIIKELVALLMENASDPRLNTNIPVNQSIPNGNAGR